MKEIENNWTKIEKLLLKAKRCLPTSPYLGADGDSYQQYCSAYHQFDEFVEHNEFELAYEQLMELKQIADMDFWDKIKQVCKLMREKE